MRRVAVTATAANATSEWVPLATALLDFWQHAETIIAGLRTRDGAAAYDDATLFLRAFGHGVIAWLWLDQALRGQSLANADLRDGLAYACRFFFEAELPQARAWLDIVGGHSDLARTIPDAALA